jgi:HSP20 family protein
MPGLVIWRNQQVEKLRRDMDRMFDRLWGDFGLSSLPIAVKEFPSIDLTDSEDSLIVNAEIPGMNPDDIKIDITDSTLSIRGEIKQDRVSEKEGFVRTESRYGSFSKTLHLPCRIVVEDVRATYREGMLNVLMPKFKQKKTRTVKIEI